jgi:hypothetical protein
LAVDRLAINPIGRPQNNPPATDVPSEVMVGTAEG